MHGGYGYMREYANSRAFVDSRVQRIYGGESEIMRPPGAGFTTEKTTALPQPLLHRGQVLCKMPPGPRAYLELPMMPMMR